MLVEDVHGRLRGRRDTADCARGHGPCQEAGGLGGAARALGDALRAQAQNQRRMNRSNQTLKRMRV